MKFTEYFQTTRSRSDRINIKLDWIEFTFYHPLKIEIQEDGRIKKWAQINDYDGKILRIVILEDGETIHNAFFDRSFKL